MQTKDAKKKHDEVRESEHASSLSHARMAVRAALLWQLSWERDVFLSARPIDRLAAAGEKGRDPMKNANRSMRDSTNNSENRLPRQGKRNPALVREAQASLLPSTTASDAPIADHTSHVTATESLEELRRCIADFDGSPFKKTARNLCFADGNPKSRVMLIGEAPGAEEDLQGKPFVGRAGKLLDRMLTALGWSREDVYITNIVHWRPPRNRTPTSEEGALLLPFTHRHIALVRPAYLIALGGFAAKVLLSRSEGILRMRGRWFAYRGLDGAKAPIPLMPMLHPAYLLRSPQQKSLAWRDWLDFYKVFRKNVNPLHADSTSAPAGASQASTRSKPR